MEHDLSHRGSRIWPLDQTSLRHHNPRCTVHHNHASRAHTTHKNCSQSVIQMAQLILRLATSHFDWPQETMWKPFLPVLNHSHWCHCAEDLIPVHFYKEINIQISSRCLDDGNYTALLCTNTSSLLSFMYSSGIRYVPTQLTPVPTYTSGCVFSHLRLVCDMYSNIRTRLLQVHLNLHYSWIDF